MFVAALFTVAKIWKQPKCLSIDDWIKKLWCVYTLEYYTATKRKEIPLFVTAWVAMEYIMLSEIGQSKKEKYHIISLTCGI